MIQTVLQIAEEFRALQETRVKTYASLQEAHKVYLKSAPDYDFPSYQKEVAKATNAFKDISQQIIGLETELGDSELAQFVRQVRMQIRDNSCRNQFCSFSSRWSDPLNFCPIYVKLLVHVL